jgi:hypothetical protein
VEVGWVGRWNGRKRERKGGKGGNGKIKKKFEKMGKRGNEGRKGETWGKWKNLENGEKWNKVFANDERGASKSKTNTPAWEQEDGNRNSQSLLNGIKNRDCSCERIFVLTFQKKESTFPHFRPLTSICTFFRIRCGIGFFLSYVE